MVLAVTEDGSTKRLHVNSKRKRTTGGGAITDGGGRRMLHVARGTGGTLACVATSLDP